MAPTATLATAIPIIATPTITPGMAAALKQVQDLRIETWNFLAIAWVFVILQTTGCFLSTLIGNFDPDDFLMILDGVSLPRPSILNV